MLIPAWRACLNKASASTGAGSSHHKRAGSAASGAQSRHQVLDAGFRVLGTIGEDVLENGLDAFQFAADHAFGHPAADGFGQEADSLAGGDHHEDGFRALGFLEDARTNAGLVAHLVKLPAKGWRGFAGHHDPIVVLEGGQVDSGGASQPVGFREGGQEAFALPEDESELGGQLARRRPGKGPVQAAGQQRLPLGGGREVRQVNLDAGMGLAELLENLHELFVEQGADEGQTQSGGFSGRQAAHSGGGGIELSEDLPGVLPVEFPGRTQRDGPGGADEELDAQFGLEGLDVPGQGRLAQVQPAGRPGEVGFLGHGQETLQFDERDPIHALMASILCNHSISVKARRDLRWGMENQQRNAAPAAYQDKSTVEEIRKRFDGEVERFSNLATGQQASVDAPLILELVAEAAGAHLRAGDTVLDLGCGAGNYTLRILQQVQPLACHLVDLSGRMLERARQRLQAAGQPDVHLYQTDFRRLELAPRSVNAIVAAATLHHLRDDEDWHAVFRKLHEWLVPGGFLYVADIVVCDEPAIQALMWSRYGRYLEGVGGPEYRDQVFAYIEKEDSPRSLRFQLELLRRVGFSQADLLHRNSIAACYYAVK